MKTYKKSRKAIKQLRKLYKSITIDDINNVKVKHGIRFGAEVMQELTGFGNSSECIVCVVARAACDNCYYNTQRDYDLDYEVPCVKTPTYKRIDASKNSKELLEAIKNRRKFMKNIL